MTGFLGRIGAKAGTAGRGFAGEFARGVAGRRPGAGLADASASKVWGYSLGRDTRGVAGGLAPALGRAVRGAAAASRQAPSVLGRAAGRDGAAARAAPGILGGAAGRVAAGGGRRSRGGAGPDPDGRLARRRRSAGEIAGGPPGPWRRLRGGDRPGIGGVPAGRRAGC